MVTTERKGKNKIKVIVTGTDISADMIKWCEENFGTGGRKSCWRFGWFADEHDTFHFRNEQHAMLFTLRWS